MGFDDLARHMASRDGQRKPVGNADQIVAEAVRVDRRMGRTRDLILGPMLLVGGLLVLALNYLVLVDAADPAPHVQRPPNGDGPYQIYFTAAAIGAVIFGVRQTVRGLIGRSR